MIYQRHLTLNHGLLILLTSIKVHQVPKSNYMRCTYQDCIYYNIIKKTMVNLPEMTSHTKNSWITGDFLVE